MVLMNCRSLLCGNLLFRVRCVEKGVCAFRIELTLPLRDDDGGDSVADEVDEGSHLGHEAVDAEEECEARDGDRSDGGERGGECDESSTSDRGGALGVEHEDEQDEELLLQGEVSIGGLCDE